MLKSYASLTRYSNSTVIGRPSLLPNVILIAVYSKYREEDSLKIDTMKAVIGGLKMCYTEAGYCYSWQIDESKRGPRKSSHSNS